MTYDQIHTLFKQRYNQSNWKKFLSEAFANTRLLAKPEILTGIDSNVASQVQKLGYITLNENGLERQIAVYEVTLAQGIVLERNRVGLRNLLRKYWKDIDAAFIAYHRPETPNWRFTYVSEINGYDAAGEFVQLKTEPKRYTYVLGEGESTRTAAERFTAIAKKGSKATLEDVKEAFSVEKLSKAFFDEYKKHYDIFCTYMVSKPNIRQTIFNGDEKAIRDFVKKLLGRIVFLYFIQKKGWLGVPAKSDWGKGDFDFLTNLFKNTKNPDLFYSELLSKLFFDTLNTKRKDDLIELVKGEPCRIPYLNGGLFEEDDKKHRNLIFPANLFQNLFDFFNQYNFTIYEDDPNDHTVAVDPEMLGHIFENLLEDNKDKGAYYTPKEIVHYMCQESLIEYLTTWFENKGYEVTGYIGFDKPEQPKLFSANEGRKGQLVLETDTKAKGKQIDRILIEKLLKKKLDDDDKKLIKKHSAEFHNALDSVKICDPAIGSGAFPMGLLHEIFTAKQTLHTFEHGNTKTFDASAVKLNIIQNSIYGVDIEKGAVDIARLRFWLSLIVDEEKPKALPNLDYKIVVGNSLVSKLGDDIIDIDWTLNETSYGLFGTDLAKQKGDLLKKISKEQKEFFNPDSDKKKLAADIRNLKIDLLITQLELMVKTQGIETQPTGTGKAIAKQTERYLQTMGWKNSIKDLQKLKNNPELPLHFFDWKLDFPEVMNEQVTTNVGFDIVIGNPPYVDSENMTINAPVLREYLKNKYSTTIGNWDLFVPFIELGILLNSLKGNFSFIIPNKVLSATYTIELRNFLAKKKILEIRDYSRLKVFKEANVYPVTLLIKNDTEKSPIRMTTMETNELVKTSNLIDPSIFYNDILWDKYFFENKFVDLLLKLSLNPKFGSLKNFKVLGAATVNEAYLFKEKIIDSNKKENIKKIINTGTIDKWSSLWGVKKTQYLKDAYVYPVISDSEIKKINITRFSQAKNPKIIIAGMSNEIEVFLDINGEYLAGKSTSIILENIENLKIYSAILNSKVASFFVKLNYHSLKMAGGYLNINNEILSSIPFPIANKAINTSLIKYVSKILENKSEGKDTTLLEQEIDHLVYKLYELTYDEVKVIDPEFSLTQAEYEAIKLE
jgi:hypothetical protein